MALSSPVLPLTTPSSSGSLNPASSSPHLMSKIPPALSSHPTIFLEHIKIGRAEECEWIMMAIMNIGAPLSPHATPTTHHLFSFYMRFSFFLPAYNIFQGDAHHFQYCPISPVSHPVSPSHALSPHLIP